LGSRYVAPFILNINTKRKWSNSLPSITTCYNTYKCRVNNFGTRSTFLVFKVSKADEVKYLGINLDRRLTWHTHITTKRKQLDLKLRNLYWIIGLKSQLSLENKLLVYEVILKPVWTYGIQLLGTAPNSNLEMCGWPCIVIQCG